MEKGYLGKVKNVEDLYDLPFFLTCGHISAKLSTTFIDKQDNETGKY